MSLYRYRCLDCNQASEEWYIDDYSLISLSTLVPKLLDIITNTRGGGWVELSVLGCHDFITYIEQHKGHNLAIQNDSGAMQVINPVPPVGIDSLMEVGLTQ